MNINQVWPEWNEECVLGEGSFGKVYRAKRIEFGRTFYSAIKVLTVPKNQQEIRHARSQGMNDDEIYAYFRGVVDNLLNEITLMDNLKGAKNIVGIEDYKIVERQGEIGWDIFIRMELLTPFDSFISAPNFSQKDVVRLGVDICTALEACEQNQILHRDIKPDNIFVSRFGEYKLGDFGIARKLETTQANLSRKGTLNYMAPEVYKSEEYGSSVDIYSLGLVLYTLLNNNRVAFLPPYPQPITYKDNEEALAKRLSGEPMVPPCNASPSLGVTVIKACAYRPEDRYRSASEFKAALIREWNALVQSGDNKEITVDSMRFEGTFDGRLQSTTNDMTSNGRLVVEGYSQETTVLDVAQGQILDYSQSSVQTNHSTAANTTVYTHMKSSKFCRWLAWPFAVVSCIFALLILTGDALTPENKTIGMSMLAIGLGILIADYNRVAIGMGMFGISLPFLTMGVRGFIDSLTQRPDITGIIMLLSGLLSMFGGIVIMTQQEVRFGGSLGLYAIAVEWLYHIYQLIYGQFSIERQHIFLNVALITVFVWAYGYNRFDKNKMIIRKILHIVGYVLGGIVLLRSVLHAVQTIIDIFKA